MAEKQDFFKDLDKVELRVPLSILSKRDVERLYGSNY